MDIKDPSDGKNGHNFQNSERWQWLQFLEVKKYIILFILVEKKKSLQMSTQFQTRSQLTNMVRE